MPAGYKSLLLVVERIEYPWVEIVGRLTAINADEQQAANREYHGQTQPDCQLVEKPA